MITVTAAIIEKDGLILAAKRKEGLHLAGYWEFPGGKLEDGEQPEECLQRELKEELGIDSVITAYLGESIFHYHGKSIRLLGYLTTHTGGEFTLTDHDEIRWLPPTELNSLTWAPADIPLIDELLDRKITEQTLSYYESNAEEYVNETLELDISEIRDTFISQLPANAHILDLGCGSGRDSRAFLDRGFTVTAVDASPAIAAIASTFLGQTVQVQKAQDIEDVNRYDAIWACASLLHIPKSKMGGVINKLITALTPNGLLYISVKHGTQERWDRRGRFFNDCSSEEITEILNCNENIENFTISTNSAMLRSRKQRWLNIFLSKI
ncbi:NUDIX domain-containing protein [Desulfosediminicola flagellatus]|uniref:NUDIX domain-containing protein n=1 Tax=Desulfosediminicola flagellatus TaxID=2569541 RepID=UPI0010AC56A6|nr:NUDIX domain-containing protein [Desulfosediminicola flagellatus]